MITKICRVCGSGIIRKHHPDGLGQYCEPCSGFTEFDDVEVEAYCPDCGDKIEVCVSCGSHGFFCGTCTSAKSSKRVIWKKTRN